MAEAIVSSAMTTVVADVTVFGSSLSFSSVVVTEQILLAAVVVAAAVNFQTIYTKPGANAPGIYIRFIVYIHLRNHIDIKKETGRDK